MICVVMQSYHKNYFSYRVRRSGVEAEERKVLLEVSHEEEENQVGVQHLQLGECTLRVRHEQTYPEQCAVQSVYNTII